jgi:hypothetical protein
MSLNFSEVFEGWRNKLFPPAHLKEAIEKVSQERMSICSGCKYNSKNKKNYKTIRIDEHCTVCQCTLSAKTKCLSCCCPKGYWTSVISQEQENEIKNGEQ